MKITDRSIRRMSQPLPLRVRFIRRLLNHVKIGSFETRLRAGALRRPDYATCLYYAALQARNLGYSAMTAVELGVAGGRGLLSLCEHAAALRKELGMEFNIVGFDAGSGLPQSNDPRDLKYYWDAGAFPMDLQALKERLAGRAQLIMGNVAETCPNWNPQPEAPLGMVAFDLDLYSSTAAALPMLEKENVLPRIWCCFDDLMDLPQSSLTGFVGVAAAIRDFNAKPKRNLLQDNLSPARVFAECPVEWWHGKIHIYHRFTHPQYNLPAYRRSNAEQLKLN